MLDLFWGFLISFFFFEGYLGWTRLSLRSDDLIFCSASQPRWCGTVCVNSQQSHSLCESPVCCSLFSLGCSSICLLYVLASCSEQPWLMGIFSEISIQKGITSGHNSARLEKRLLALTSVNVPGFFVLLTSRICASREPWLGLSLFRRAFTICSSKS